MEIKLQLSDLYLGNIDAKHELISNSKDERSRFSDSFFMPENIILDHYINGAKYFVTGLKGTGKTALLRYLAIQAEETINAETSFILFKSEIEEQERKDFAKAAGTMIVDSNSPTNESEEFNNEFEDVWMWFLHRHIVETICKNDSNPFLNDTNWKKYVACITAPNHGDEESGIKRLIPKLKRGNVEVSAGLVGITGTLGLEFDWDDSNHTRIKFSSLVKQANNLFSKLNRSEHKLYIFLDELELTLDNNKKYTRDKKLIRDLIIAINELNMTCKKNKFNIHLIAAIRSEVLSAVESSGKEINKIINDFSTPIIWHQSGGNISNHPILQIIIKRLIASEKYHKIHSDNSPEAIWKRYFPESIQNEKTEKYILHLTWYRPRDVIRLLNIAQQQSPKSTSFSHQVFDTIRKTYSSESWTELSEELRTIYRENEIDGIKRLFYGISNPFYFNSINQHVNNIKEMYSSVESLLDNHKLGEILSNSYRVGLIGNSGNKYRWAHRGDDEILLEKQMMLHRALWASLSIEHNIHV